MSLRSASSDAFARFVAEFPAFDHVETGLGVIFAAFENGLSWERIGTDSERKIYGGLLFHVVGATFRTSVDYAPIKKTKPAQILWPFVWRAARILPLKQRRKIRELFVDTERTTREGSIISKRAENEALMADPEGYVKAQVDRPGASEIVYH